MRDIIILATARVHNPYSSTAVSLAKEFAKSNRVFFVESPYTLKDKFLRKEISNTSGRARVLDTSYAELIEENLWLITSKIIIPINWLPEGFLYNLFSKLNEGIFFKRVKKLIEDYNIKNFILFNVFNPFYGINAPGWFRPAISIYYSVDNISNTKYFSRHGIKKEIKILQNYDIVLATSITIYEKIKKVNSNAYYLPNGADFSLFSETMKSDITIPQDLKVIPEPRVVYIGNIDSRIDVELIEKLLTESPDLNILFIGPLNSKKFIELTKLKNLFALGSKSIELLPAYLKYCHCAIIPFVKNGFTESIYPLKINEYLASGLPTVTTNFSSSLREFEDVVNICDNSNDFVRSVVNATKEFNNSMKTQRVKHATNNSWAARSKEFWKIVNNFPMHNTY